MLQLTWKETNDGKGVWATHGNLRLVVKESFKYGEVSHWWGIYEDDTSVDMGYGRDEDDACARAEQAAGL